MSIKRNEVAALKYGNVVTGRALRPVHPGEVLLHEFIEPLGLSRYRVAKAIGVPQRRIDEICSGKRAMTADTALRLGRLFSVEAQLWMNLQSKFDLEVAQQQLGSGLEEAIIPLQRAA